MKVLCAWEFGGDLGHVRRLIPIARELRAMGHSVSVAFRDSSQLDVAMSEGFEVFVAPLLVIVGHLMGRPLGLEFTILEVVAVMLSVAAVALLTHDGKTNWFEGFQLLAIYAILAIAFYFI